MSDRDTADAYCRHITAQGHVRMLDQAAAVLTEWFELTSAQAEAVIRSWADAYEVSPCRVAEALVRGVYLGRRTSCDPLLLRQVEASLRRFPMTHAASLVNMKTGA